MKRDKGLSGAIIQHHLDEKTEGKYLQVSVDFILLHDPLLALLLPELKDLEKEILHKEKILVTVDHFSPPSTIERADMVKQVLAFVQEKKIPNCLVYRGICHQLLVEGNWVKPGMLVLGTDSHTTTAGALGCFATGMGSTDILYSLMTGKTWLRPPEAVRIDLTGMRPSHIMGKDIILELLGGGEDRFLYQALEFYDHDSVIPMDDRFAICNMVVEGGAKNGLFFPDEVTGTYLRSRDGRSEAYGAITDKDLTYDHAMAMYLPDLSPKLAMPHSPANVCDVAEADQEEIDQVFIGSCTGGRLQDLAAAVTLLKGKRISRGMRLLVTPASQEIYRKAIDMGYIQALLDAGGTILNPSCGLCGGIDKGILAGGETCLSTSNRNFQGRMGDPASRVYLASPLTAAATALRGKITDPREIMN